MPNRTAWHGLGMLAMHPSPEGIVINQETLLDGQEATQSGGERYNSGMPEGSIVTADTDVFACFDKLHHSFLLHAITSMENSKTTEQQKRNTRKIPRHWIG